MRGGTLKGKWWLRSSRSNLKGFERGKRSMARLRELEKVYPG